jgi:hypothetical protein
VAAPGPQYIGPARRLSRPAALCQAPAPACTRSSTTSCIRPGWPSCAPPGKNSTISTSALACSSPVLQIDGGERRLGRWDSEARLLGIAHHHIWHHAWDEVLATLKHEMAHQYVDEVLGVRDETAHGPAFRQVCARRGIDARALGVPVDVGAAGEGGEGAILARIAKLLRLAESPNEHEAQAAMRQAQRLMLKHNLDAAEARAARGYVFKHVGVASGRVDEASRWVATILGEFFFVECIWSPSPTPRTGRASAPARRRYAPATPPRSIAGRTSCAGYLHPRRSRPPCTRP